MTRNARIRAKKARESNTGNPDAKRVLCGQVGGVKIYAVFNS
tara:strand:- start:10 stop:135 length:126 start_codon:yes stop_codon:yes gene_type:complete